MKAGSGKIAEILDALGCPVKMSESPVEVTRSPRLGELTDEFLRGVLGYNDREVSDVQLSGAVGDAPIAQAAE